MNIGSNKMKPKHVHAEWVRLWLDGVEVEYQTFLKWRLVTDIREFGWTDAKFRVKPEPTYEYQWLLKGRNGIFKITDSYYESELEAHKDYHAGDLIERLDKYKRLTKEKWKY